jgi:DMSO/TMAO reductase YedYZ molybdopterin-dependent catalytic subunit
VTDERRTARTLVDRAVAALEASHADPVARRRFLQAGTGALAASLLSACGLAGNDRAKRMLAYASRKNETLERWLLRHTAMDQPASGAIIAGARFPSYFVSDVVPAWRGDVPWTLAVTGLVKTPLRLDLRALLAMAQVTQRVDHFCVEGWNAVARFTGVRLRDLATLAQPLPGADFVDFQSFDDGYHESWDIESALHPQTLVVLAKDGAPLSPAYGAPARVHSPVKLGYKNTKYLTTIEFRPARNGGYWSDRGYEWYGGT